MIFVKTEQTATKVRVRPLSGQQMPDGTAINTKYLVSAEESARTTNPIGTVFAVESLEEDRGFYRAKPLTLYPVTGPNAMPVYVSEYEKYLDTRIEGVASNVMPPSPSKQGTKRSTKTELQVLLEDYPIPNIDDDGMWVPAKVWSNLLLQIANKENTLLAGPTGTAKTKLVTYLAKKYDKQLHIFDMSAQQDPIAGLLGVHRLNDKGHSVFDYAKFAKVIQEPDTWILLDELNRAPLTATNILFPCTDFRRTLEISTATSTGVRDLEVHPDVIFFATANLGSEYAGTNQVDRALLDRFSLIELEYPDVKTETQLIEHYSKASHADAEAIAKVAERLRTAKFNGDISDAPSVRHTLKMGVRVRQGLPLKLAIESIVVPLYQQDERETVKTTIGSI